MSKGSMMGHTDRRIPVKTDPSAVHERYEKIYRKCPELRWQDRALIETRAFESAMRKLDDQDRICLEECQRNLKEKCGRNFGYTAANQILAKLGVWLIENGVR